MWDPEPAVGELPTRVRQPSENEVTKREEDCELKSNDSASAAVLARLRAAAIRTARGAL